MAGLLECLFSCDLKKLKTIFEKIDVNCEIPGTDGCTPLHVVAGMERVSGKEHVLAFLFEMGADPNARSYENLTPVHIAAMWDNCYELEKLLQHGGNPWLTDNENKNSFDMAADNYAYGAFQLLNIYLAEDKLNFKSVRHEPESPIKAGADFAECVGGEIVEDSKLFSNTSFMTANENFPVILSSTDEESDDLVLNMSKYLKRKSMSMNKQRRQTQKLVNFDFSDSAITEESERHTDITPTKCTDNENDVTKKNSINNLNTACIISSNEADEIDDSSPNLNNSNDSSNETIIESFDNSGIVLVSTRNNYENLFISDSSVSGIGNDWKSIHSNESSTLSYCSSHEILVAISKELQSYSNSKIFEELKNLGDNPGPVLDHTRQVYLQRLARYKHGCLVSCDLPEPKYCPEVYLFLENKLDMARAHALEQSIAKEFDVDSGQKWREGSQRCCFNYFLLDPRVTQDLPARGSNLTKEQKFLTFLDSLFYVGKGTRGRPYMHLLEAAKSMVSGTLKNEKINHILEIWESGFGVISLHCFENSIPVEAYTREACIIEAVGIDNLTNIKKGDFYGSCARLTTSRKRLIGISLLERALQIFLLEGERSIKPKDIRSK